MKKILPLWRKLRHDLCPFFVTGETGRERHDLRSCEVSAVAGCKGSDAPILVISGKNDWYFRIRNNFRQSSLESAS